MDARLPLTARLYVAAVVAAGGLTLLALAVTGLPALLGRDDDLLVLGLLFVAVLIGEQVSIRSEGGEVAPSTAFVLALLIAFGPAAAAIASAVACVLGDLRSGKPASRLLFNVAQYTLALTAAGAVLDATTSLGDPVQIELGDVPGLALAVAAYFALNTGSVSLAICLHERTSFRRQVSSDFMHHSITEVTLLGLAPITVVALEHSPVLAPLLALPLLAVHRAGHNAVLNTHIAAHDALTGLPNRVLFQDRLEQALERADRDGGFVAVMLLDLDRFKQINDTLGHATGDAVLREISGRLAGALGEGDTVARLGGDEFAVLVRSAPGPHEAATLAERLRNAVLPPVDVDEVSLSLDVSIGLAWHPEHGEDAEVLVQRADVAMYEAKAGGGGVRAYAAERDGNTLERLAIAQDLRGAVRRGEVEVHFQPQVDLATGRVVGAEALARWTHPTLGPVPPTSFIPVAEETGVITPLTDHVLAEAIAGAGRWRRDGMELHVAVNLSARTLSDGALAARVAQLCATHALPPELVVLEITESMLLADPEAATATLERLVGLGVTIAIDDFGTGYSSLEHLKRLPIRELKIDRSLIAGLDGDARDRAIVRGALELAHALGVRVVAEGVEHEGMAGELRAMGCEVGQGWLWSRAVPAGELPAAVERVGVARGLVA